MATFTAIQNKKQSAGAMRGVLDYVEKGEKTRCAARLDRQQTAPP